MSLWSLFRRSSTALRGKAVHITDVGKSITRTVSRTGLFLKKQLWIFPVIAAVILAIVGVTTRTTIESMMRENLRSQLETLLGVETAMMESWIKDQFANTAALANSPAIRKHVYELLEAVDPTLDQPVALQSLKLHALLQKDLAPGLSAGDYGGYFIADKDKRILSSASTELIGQKDIPEYNAVIAKALEGEPSISPPFSSVTLMRDDAGKLRTGVPTMMVCAPIRDDSFQVVAVLALRIRPEREFSRILQLGRFGKSGETYAFDKNARMVSNSRFDEELMLVGLISDEDNAQSILQVGLHDPGGDLTAGYRPAKRRRDLPLTKMAKSAIAGEDGVDVDGYRDYRGVAVVGAWTWLPRYQMGIATEMNSVEAFRPVVILRYAFWGLFILLGISAAAIFAFTVMNARLQREAQKAAVAAKKLGQYRLEEKLGSGGMGIVYKGYHAILRRPTAIKMLHVEKVNETSIERFEREVQITCQLNNPHTVAVYDFGRTDEGVFYYAMEYLDGIDLQSLVDKYGPLPEARVIHILEQICGSLYEAHLLGLVHRDIKPANIMLNRRGGEPDVVKVLDFGLVKALDEGQQASLTAANGLTGTPLYMSPEAIQSPNAIDARSDLYAVGATGYFLLTGKPVFDASNIVELCQQHVDKLPDPPSQRTTNPISGDLESLLLACLEKSRAKRPQTARELALRLERCTAAAAWSIEEAEMWWSRHERGVITDSTTPETAKSATAAYDRTYVANSDE
jgi:eukaryotic-like serine/threonine-protein kinase